jgi:hypothetical protein
MVGYLRRHHLALLALFVALGGTSYAAVELSKNSVGAREIKRSAVRSAEVKDRTLREQDFMLGQLPAGSNGAQGPVGPTGAQGPAGPSGVVSSRTISGIASTFNLPGNMGNSEVTPAGCRTAAYTAGPGEVAVINLQVTGSPNPPMNDVLYLKVMSSENGGGFDPVGGESQADTLNVSTTHVTNSHVQPLTAGIAYIWGAGLASNAAITMAVAHCAGNVVIYRSP